MIDLTMEATKADEFSLYLTGDNNFRYSIYPEYKGQRPDERPRHLHPLRQYVQEKYNAVVADGCEADDLLGIEQCKSQNTIICSLDKDLRQIPGNHYSFEITGVSVNGKRWTKPAEFATVSEAEGLKFFYYQLLVGDPADNLRGVYGMGKVKATNLLKDLHTEEEMFEAVRSCYSSDEEMEMQGACLWIWRKPNDIWRLPTFETTKREGQGPTPTEMD
jgi:5'-3' exonuclease